MTVRETAQLLALLQSWYPTAFSRLDEGPEALRAMAGLWHRVLGDLPYAAAEGAVLRFVSADGKGFPPSPGQIRQQAAELSSRPGLSELDAWALVRRAASDGIYHSAERFAELPAGVQRAVGSPETLRAWAMLPESELDTVTASHFQRTWREVRAREELESKLPPALRGKSAEPLPGLPE